MPYFSIRLLAKDLLPSMAAAAFVGPKQAIPFSLSRSTSPMHERVVRRDDGEIDRLAHRKLDDLPELGRRDRHADCVRSDAAVAGQRVNLPGRRDFPSAF